MSYLKNWKEIAIIAAASAIAFFPRSISGGSLEGMISKFRESGRCNYSVNKTENITSKFVSVKVDEKSYDLELKLDGTTPYFTLNAYDLDDSSNSIALSSDYDLKSSTSCAGKWGVNIATDVIDSISRYFDEGQK